MTFDPSAVSSRSSLRDGVFQLMVTEFEKIEKEITKFVESKEKLENLKHTVDEKLEKLISTKVKIKEALDEVNKGQGQIRLSVAEVNDINVSGVPNVLPIVFSTTKDAKTTKEVDTESIKLQIDSIAESILKRSHGEGSKPASITADDDIAKTDENEPILKKPLSIPDVPPTKAELDSENRLGNQEGPTSISSQLIVGASKDETVPSSDKDQHIQQLVPTPENDQVGEFELTSVKGQLSRPVSTSDTHQLNQFMPNATETSQNQTNVDESRLSEAVTNSDKHQLIQLESTSDKGHKGPKQNGVFDLRVPTLSTAFADTKTVEKTVIVESPPPELPNSKAKPALPLPTLKALSHGIVPIYKKTYAFDSLNPKTDPASPYAESLGILKKPNAPKLGKIQHLKDPQNHFHMLNPATELARLLNRGNKKHDYHQHQQNTQQNKNHSTRSRSVERTPNSSTNRSSSPRSLGRAKIRSGSASPVSGFRIPSGATRQPQASDAAVLRLMLKEAERVDHPPNLNPVAMRSRSESTHLIWTYPTGQRQGPGQGQEVISISGSLLKKRLIETPRMSREIYLKYGNFPKMADKVITGKRLMLDKIQSPSVRICPAPKNLPEDFGIPSLKISVSDTTHLHVSSKADRDLDLSPSRALALMISPEVIDLSSVNYTPPQH